MGSPVLSPGEMRSRFSTFTSARTCSGRLVAPAHPVAALPPPGRQPPFRAPQDPLCLVDRDLYKSGIHKVTGGPCGPGTFCPNGTAAPFDCGPGTYNPIYRQEACVTCPAGHYCTYATIVPNSCPPGHYCPAGSGEDMGPLCPAGSFNTLFGLRNISQCQLCDGGRYCPFDGMNFTSEEICLGGYYCQAGAVDGYGTLGVLGVCWVCGVLCCVALRCVAVALRCVALCCVVLCCVVLCCVVLCCVVLCCVVLCRRRCYQRAKAGMSTHGYR